MNHEREGPLRKIHNETDMNLQTKKGEHHETN
jgi:hypothetical protein